MGVFPLAAGVVATVFCVALFRQYRARGKTYQALWSASLGMYAVASFCLFAGDTLGWETWWFRGYWLFGATLTVPFLAAGEALLLGKASWVRPTVLGLLGVVTLIGVAVVVLAPIDAGALAGDLPRGAEAFGDGGALLLARLYSYVAYVFLLGGALWSAWKMRGRPELRDRFWGTLLIALGATIVAAGSAFAATAILSGFSITLAAGVTVMFLGFMKASGPRQVAPADDAVEQPA